MRRIGDVEVFGRLALTLSLLAFATYAISCEDALVGIKLSNDTGYYYYYFSPHSWQKVFKLVQIEGGKRIERAKLYITLVNETTPTVTGRLIIKPANLMTIVGAENSTEAVTKGDFRFPSGTLIVCIQQGNEAYILIQRKRGEGWWVGAGKTVPIMATKEFAQYEIELQGGGKVFFFPDGAVGESGVKLVPQERGGGGSGLPLSPSSLQQIAPIVLVAAALVVLLAIAAIG